jgi:hypothetical protein
MMQIRFEAGRDFVFVGNKVIAKAMDVRLARLPLLLPVGTLRGSET